MKRLQQTAGTWHRGPRNVRVADPRPISALKPVGPTCSGTESKGGDPGPVRPNRQVLHRPRGQTPDNLRATGEILIFAFTGPLLSSLTVQSTHRITRAQ